jgi:hypothetical protein
MRAVCHGVVDTDTATIELNTIELLDALSRVLNGRHTDEAEATRPTRLLTRAFSGQTRHSRGETYTLVIHNGYLLNATKAREFVIEITLLRANAEAKHTENVAGRRRLNITGVSHVESPD